MRRVKIELGKDSYNIYIGIPSLKDIPRYLNRLSLFKKGVIITDQNVDHYYGTKVLRALKNGGYQVDKFVVPAGEKSKSLKVANDIYSFLNEKGIERKSFIIALGGGVVGDLAGFIASTYRRGIPFVQIPTTVLSQVDSSVGGKVAVNIPHGKNFVGSFYQPKVVLINLSVLKTLPKKEMSNGVAEVIKYGIIRDKSLFFYLEKNMQEFFKLEAAVLKKIILRSCQIKGEVVQKDEKEQGLREILNFGHTVGHTIEEIYRYKYISHGEAISLGMIAAAILSENRKKIGRETVERIIRLNKKADLPIIFKKDLLEKVIDFLKYDKKVRAGKNRFVLMESLGDVSFGNEVSNSEVKSALEKMLELTNNR
ncbi:3-dehydroquinate synthase [Candidatus Auribacterota bacterium]